MKLKNVNGHLSELPETHRPAIVGLIDMTVEEKMDRVLAKLDNMQVQIDAKFDAMESKFDYRLEAMESKFDGMQMQIAAMQNATDAKLESMQRSTDAKLESMQRSNDVQIRSIKWTIIVSLTVFGLAIKFFPSGFIS